MAIDMSKLNEGQLAALMRKVQARLSELQLEKVARVRDKVIAIITSEGLDYAELMEHTSFSRRKKRGKAKPKYRNPKNPGERRPSGPFGRKVSGTPAAS